MEKKTVFYYVRGVLMLIASFAAVTWFMLNIDDLLSPRLVYIVRITCGIGFTITNAVMFGGCCYILFYALFRKKRFDALSTRLLVGGIALGWMLFLQYAFDFPLGLPERIERITTLIMG